MNHNPWITYQPIESIQADEVYLLKIDLEYIKPTLSNPCLIPSLNDEEAKRCQQFRFKKDRISFAISRYFTKHVLSDLTAIDASQIQFDYNAYGKPFFINNSTNIQFNISHSGDLILIGLGHNYELGVDVEKWHPNIEFDDIAQSVFSLEEQRYLRQASKQDKQKVFYHFWSLKESFIKEEGLGLQLPLDSFTMAFTDKPYQNCISSVAWKPSLLDSLSSIRIPIKKDYSAAVTMQKHIKKLHFLDASLAIKESFK